MATTITKDKLKATPPARPFFWSYISREEMTRLVSIASSRGAREAAEDVFGSSPSQKFLRNLLREERGDFGFLLPVPSTGRILDFGCGWGTTSIALSFRFRNILGFDATLENLEFARLRMQEEQRTNILFVQVEPLENSHLPCAPGSLDCVILVGVLEWVASSTSSGSPEKMQMQFLKDIRGLLKPGGSIYLAIENRFGAPYWLGRPDPHTYVPFLSLLPRRIANSLMMFLKGCPYRTYTHSHRNLAAILRKVGFEDLRFYLPVTDYRWPQTLIPLDKPAAVRCWLRNAFIPRRRIHYLYAALLWLMTSFRLAAFLAPDFIVIAKARHD